MKEWIDGFEEKAGTNEESFCSWEQVSILVGFLQGLAPPLSPHHQLQGLISWRSFSPSFLLGSTEASDVRCDVSRFSSFDDKERQQQCSESEELITICGLRRSPRSLCCLVSTVGRGVTPIWELS